jgi:hypothetical protein
LLGSSVIFVRVPGAKVRRWDTEPSPNIKGPRFTHTTWLVCHARRETPTSAKAIRSLPAPQGHTVSLRLAAGVLLCFIQRMSLAMLPASSSSSLSCLC